MTGIAPRCARDGNVHVAAPPSSARNSRRLIHLGLGWRIERDSEDRLGLIIALDQTVPESEWLSDKGWLRQGHAEPTPHTGVAQTSPETAKRDSPDGR